MQYNETDWEFAKRILSRLSMSIIPYTKNSNIAFYGGVIGTASPMKLTKSCYETAQDMYEFNKKRNQGLKVEPDDETYYVVKSRDIAQIGDSISFHGEKLYVFRAKTEMKGSEIISTYDLKRRKAFQTPYIRNYELVGASFTGTVKKVRAQEVQVMVDCEGNQNEAELKWFPYATVYSSSDHAAWYCMPEIGDKIRLFYPDEKDNDAYVISAVHVHMGEQDPGTKFLRNPYGKEIRFSKDRLVITNNDGLTIDLDDEQGILLKSDKDIIMDAKEKIEITSRKKSIDMNAKTKIGLEQDKSNITLQGDIYMNAEQVHIQNIE